MSATFSHSTHKALRPTPTVWCCAKALAVVGAGAACWAGAIIVLMRALGS